MARSINLFMSFLHCARVLSLMLSDGSRKDEGASMNIIMGKAWFEAAIVAFVSRAHTEALSILGNPHFTPQFMSPLPFEVDARVVWDDVLACNAWAH